MRNVEELINTTDPGWPIVTEWIKEANNKIEILTVDVAKAKEALYKTQVSTRSPMGAIIFSTGGILVDNGWIRILGSGNEKLNRSLPDWNVGKFKEEFGENPRLLLIADDALGGFFILNGGDLGSDLGNIYYFAPDNLEYEPLDITYSEFLMFCFNNDLDEFYRNQRWNNWQAEVSKLDGNSVFNFVPFLWSKEGKDINKNNRKKIPVEEQFSFNIEIKKQLAYKG
jgi:hypothetical protein